MDPCYVATNYFVFVSFFPQLVAGPIERAQNLLPQIENERKFSRKTFVDGFLLIIWGFETPVWSLPASVSSGGLFKG